MRYKRLDFPIGTKFGNLTYMGFAYMKGYNSYGFYKCDCGKTAILLNTKAKRGGYIGCSRNCKLIKKGKKRIEPAYYVNDNGCRICYNKSKHRFGYPMITVNRKTISVHRYMYEKKYGPIPKGMCLCHKCDNPACINPDHMFIGTYKDNNMDMAKKGRIKTRKLSFEQIQEIGNDKTTRPAILARKYRVGICSIYDIQTGRTYSWLTNILLHNKK